jgi:hypothetical protein
LNKDKISLAQLETFLFKSADILRGKMDASEFKEFFPSTHSGEQGQEEGPGGSLRRLNATSASSGTEQRLCGTTGSTTPATCREVASTNHPGPRPRCAHYAQHQNDAEQTF